jgi:hypothetical protein
MLITLQSNKDTDASDFVNFFKETVQIEPNSEIAFVNIGYRFEDNAAFVRETQIMLINLDSFQIKSICKDGGVQKAIGSVPYGGESPPHDEGEYYHENYNLIYHQLGNKQVENHNQLRVRLTNDVGGRLLLLKHPTTITIDVRPRAL